MPFEISRSGCRAAVRRALLLGALALPLAAAGCGWEPLYAARETGPADAELRTIRVAPIAERIGQKLELALRQSFNPSSEPAPQHYLLRTTLLTVRQDLGVLTQGIGTRGRLDASATFALIDTRKNAQIFGGVSHVAESFDILANEYADIVAEDDARTRSVEELRRDIVTRLTLFMQRGAAEAAGRR